MDAVDTKAIKEYSSTGRHQECLQACQQLLQSKPENPLPWKYAGKSLLALGQFEKSQQCLVKAHQLDSKDPETTIDIGNIFLKLGRTEDAIEWYERSLKINNNYAPAINNVAKIKRQSGNNQEAVNLFKQAIQSDPQHVKAYIGAAASFLTLGDLDQAESFAIRGIEMNAHAPGINEILGITFQKRKKFQQAVESYQKELAINSKSITSLLNLGLLLLQQGQAAAAIEPLTRAAQINPSEQCSLLLAQAYQNIDKPKEAIIEFKKIDIAQSQNKMIPFNLGLCLLNTGRNVDAIEAFKLAIKMDDSFLPAWGNIGTALINEGRHYEALQATQKVLELKPDNPTAHINLGGIYKHLGNLDQALSSTLKSLDLKPDNPIAHMNLGSIYQDLGNLDQALSSTLKSLDLKPDNPIAHMNLGSIYQDLGNLDQALTSTLKSLELKPDNPTAHTNLGGIYIDLRNLDQALASTLKSLELKGDNPGAVKNLSAFIERLNLSASNAKNLIRAYELLIHQVDISHQKLSKIFLQAFLPIIQKASLSDSIISDGNQALKALAADWRFLKSLTLMIPPSSEAEGFFTRLRNELLNLAIQMGTVPQELKPLTEALAAQCFLNEYVYTSSQEEDDSIAQLIEAAIHNQEDTNRYLAIIGCYKAIYTTGISPEFINNYPTTDDSSKQLITAQFKEPFMEQEIKTSFQEKQNIDGTISQKVQEMYEDNPYPRFKFADYTNTVLAKKIHKSIEIEVTRKSLSFSDELKSSTATPKVLIAGCGTGNQVIGASRYKNAAITAIDLSSSSLAYAIRKSMEYGMGNVKFKQMDLLDVAELESIFDVIECGGVLHHMDNPSDGLTALVQQLKPGGYIKLGLYSEIARKVIVEARKTIQMLGINSAPESIRNFRKKVLAGEIKELLALPKCGVDFYSLSGCRDLCFHVQEYRFTTESLQKLLDSHGLTFCGFMVPAQIRKIYQEQYPEDSDMISLTNWGHFEEKYPSTFKGMYQFWACKQTQKSIERAYAKRTPPTETTLLSMT